MGIAEGHAVTMCAGMAKQGMVPVFAVYSTFLQRSYDMLIHDVALQKLHVVFCVDRAGLVGEDGETHHGVFDVGFLDTIPGITVFCPANYRELEQMLDEGIYRVKGPVAIRYPRGGEGAYREGWDGRPMTVLRSGSDVTLAGYGTQVNALLEAAEMLAKENISAEVVKLNTITPLAGDELCLSVQKTGSLWFYEESMDFNCVGRRVAADWAVGHMLTSYIALRNLGDRVPPQGTVDQLRRMNNLDAESIVRQIREVTGLEKAAGRSSG